MSSIASSEALPPLAATGLKRCRDVSGPFGDSETQHARQKDFGYETLAVADTLSRILLTQQRNNIALSEIFRASQAGATTNDALPDLRQKRILCKEHEGMPQADYENAVESNANSLAAIDSAARFFSEVYSCRYMTLMPVHTHKLGTREDSESEDDDDEMVEEADKVDWNAFLKSISCDITTFSTYFSAAAEEAAELKSLGKLGMNVCIVCEHFRLSSLCKSIQLGKAIEGKLDYKEVAGEDVAVRVLLREARVVAERIRQQGAEFELQEKVNLEVV